MKSTIILFFILYSVATYYVSLRGWQGLQLSKDWLAGKCYQLLIGTLTLAYPLARFGAIYSSDPFIDNFILLGALWIGALYYLFLFALLIDLLRQLNKKINFLPKNIVARPDMAVIFSCCCTLLLISYGSWNAQHPITRTYEITIAKTAGSLDTLQVVMVSDIQLGNIITNQRLTKLVNRINQLEPDIILLAGDTIDGDPAILSTPNVINNFNRLHSTFGTYAILGNHEYFAQHPEKVIQSLEKSNIHVLRDQWSLIENSFYLIGRDDVEKQEYTNKSRQELATIMTGINHALPIILLDHQADNLEDGLEQGVDLQLSGHNQFGQLFPNNLITEKIGELDWGYLHKKNLQVLISCGFGTWGPPIRIGSRPEILNITIHFTTAIM